MKAFLLIILIGAFSGCATKPTLGSKGPPVSKLNTKNLVKNPTTGIFVLKSTNTNDTINIFGKKIPNGIPLPARTNSIRSEEISHPGSPDSSLSISANPITATDTKRDAIKIDWFKLLMYYFFVIHIVVIGYLVHKKKLLEKIKNPFLENK